MLVFWDSLETVLWISRSWGLGLSLQESLRYLYL